MEIIIFFLLIILLFGGAGNAQAVSAVLPSAQTTGGEQAAKVSKITVSFKLDGWLISGNYGSGFWGSPSVLGPTTQGDKIFKLETKVSGLGNRPKWVSKNPNIAKVSPRRGKQVTITVLRDGQTSIKITGNKKSKILKIKAFYTDEGVLKVTFLQ